MNKDKRNKEIMLLLVIGLSGPLIGEMYGIKRSRIHQIKKENYNLFLVYSKKSKDVLMQEYIDIIKK